MLFIYIIGKRQGIMLSSSYTKNTKSRITSFGLSFIIIHQGSIPDQFMRVKLRVKNLDTITKCLRLVRRWVERTIILFERLVKCPIDHLLQVDQFSLINLPLCFSGLILLLMSMHNLVGVRCQHCNISESLFTILFLCLHGILKLSVLGSEGRRGLVNFHLFLKRF